MLIIQELKTMRNFNQYITFLPCDYVRHFESNIETLVEFAQERGRNEILNYAKKLGFLK